VALLAAEDTVVLEVEVVNPDALLDVAVVLEEEGAVELELEPVVEGVVLELLAMLKLLVVLELLAVEEEDAVLELLLIEEDRLFMERSVDVEDVLDDVVA
jgi:hypothetical protein